MLLYAGLNVSNYLFSDKHKKTIVIDEFSEILLPNLQNLIIGWNYCLIWQGKQVFITGNIGRNESNLLLTIPEASAAG